jgi:hypothetical protein
VKFFKIQNFVANAEAFIAVLSESAVVLCLNITQTREMILRKCTQGPVP